MILYHSRVASVVPAGELREITQLLWCGVATASGVNKKCPHGIHKQPRAGGCPKPLSSKTPDSRSIGCGYPGFGVAILQFCFRFRLTVSDHRIQTRERPPGSSICEDRGRTSWTRVHQGLGEFPFQDSKVSKTPTVHPRKNSKVAWISSWFSTPQT